MASAGRLSIRQMESETPKGRGCRKGKEYERELMRLQIETLELGSGSGSGRLEAIRHVLDSLPYASKDDVIVRAPDRRVVQPASALSWTSGGRARPPLVEGGRVRRCRGGR